MRKGRSSRRCRVSRPPLGSKPPPPVDALATELGPSSPPRVIFGVAPSEPPPSEGSGDTAHEARLEAEGPRLIDRVVSSLAIPPEEPDAPGQADLSSGDAARSSVTAEPGETLAKPAAVTAEPGETLAKPAAVTAEPAETLAKPAAVTAEPAETLAKPAAVTVEPAETLAKPAAVTAEPAETLAKPAAVTAEPAETLAKPEESSRDAMLPRHLDPDDISVPPIGDVSVDEKFFSEGDLSRHDPAEAVADDILAVSDKATRKSEPRVVERRTRFVRYVRWAVLGASIVCMAAVARTTLSSPSSVAKSAPTFAQRSTLAEPLPSPVIPKAAEPAAFPVAEPAVSGVEPSAKTATPAIEPTSSATGPVASSETKPELPSDGKSAKEEKGSARAFLEKRKITEAIEAGEHSVALDPTDSEAWLILGAAYQEKGNIVEARRAYSSCAKEGRTELRGECMKMLR